MSNVTTYGVSHVTTDVAAVLSSVAEQGREPPACSHLITTPQHLNMPRTRLALRMRSSMADNAAELFMRHLPPLKNECSRRTCDAAPCPVLNDPVQPTHVTRQLPGCMRSAPMAAAHCLLKPQLAPPASHPTNHFDVVVVLALYLIHWTALVCTGSIFSLARRVSPACPLFCASQCRRSSSNCHGSTLIRGDLTAWPAHLRRGCRVRPPHLASPAPTASVSAAAAARPASWGRTSMCSRFSAPCTHRPTSSNCEATQWNIARLMTTARTPNTAAKAADVDVTGCALCQAERVQSSGQRVQCLRWCVYFKTADPTRQEAQDLQCLDGWLELKHRDIW